MCVYICIHTYISMCIYIYVCKKTNKFLSNTVRSSYFSLFRWLHIQMVFALVPKRAVKLTSNSTVLLSSQPLHAQIQHMMEIQFSKSINILFWNPDQVKLLKQFNLVFWNQDWVRQLNHLEAFFFFCVDELRTSFQTLDFYMNYTRSIDASFGLELAYYFAFFSYHDFFYFLCLTLKYIDDSSFTSLVSFPPTQTTYNRKPEDHTRSNCEADNDSCSCFFPLPSLARQGKRSSPSNENS